MRADFTGRSLMSGLEHYWPLNEASGTRYAVVGGLDLSTLTGTPSGGVGKFGTATVQSTSTAMTSTATMVHGNRDFTYAIWCYPTTGSGVGNYTMGRWESPLVALLYLSGGESNQWKWHIYNDAQSGYVGYFLGQVAQFNVWQLVFGWHDAVNDSMGMQTFYDSPTGIGAIYTAATGGAVPEADATTMRFGYTVGSNTFQGNLCDAAIWGRVLTLTERLWLFNKGAGRQFPWTGPAIAGSYHDDR
jgi:hypothetical protein